MAAGRSIPVRTDVKTDLLKTEPKPSGSRSPHGRAQILVYKTACHDEQDMAAEHGRVQAFCDRLLNHIRLRIAAVILRLRASPRSKRHYALSSGIRLL